MGGILRCRRIFPLAQLENPATAEAEKILRACVHCGFCTATCPTFVLLGDELDSPRGRIYLIKDMLENDRPADALTVKHIDRCLSCLACMTACPSGVNYMHLVDGARSHIEKTFRTAARGPAVSRRCWLLFSLIRTGSGLPHGRARFGRLSQLFILAFGRTGRRLAAMLRLAPKTHSAASACPATRSRPPRGRPIAAGSRFLSGCVQQVLRPDINDAAIRLLARLGVESRACRGRRLLRRAPASSGQGGGRPGPGAAQYRSLDGRNRAART